MAYTEINDLRIGIRTALQVKADEQYANKMKAYMKGKFEYYGLTAGERRSIVNPHIKDSKKLSVDLRFDLAEALWQEECRECHHVGMDILSTVESKVDQTHLSRVERLISTLGGIRWIG
jgi:3-methyladenine DNA glycosylase AlkD